VVVIGVLTPLPDDDHGAWLPVPGLPPGQLPAAQVHGEAAGGPRRGGPAGQGDAGQRQAGTIDRCFYFRKLLSHHPDLCGVPILFFSVGHYGLETVFYSGVSNSFEVEGRNRPNAT